MTNLNEQEILSIFSKKTLQVQTVQLIPQNTNSKNIINVFKGLHREQEGSSPVCEDARFGWGCHCDCCCYGAISPILLCRLRTISYFVGFAKHPTS